jgi:hypothetical protein
VASGSQSKKFRRAAPRPWCKQRLHDGREAAWSNYEGEALVGHNMIAVPAGRQIGMMQEENAQTQSGSAIDVLQQVDQREAILANYGWPFTNSSTSSA